MSAADGEEEEEDYMSEAFLQACLPKDVKPGLKRVSRLSYRILN